MQGTIVSDAINFIMTSLGLQPLDVYINDLLNVSAVGWSVRACWSAAAVFVCFFLTTDTATTATTARPQP